mmetsp:Transcript_4591/g.29118  ORF Transcript_4591/g.29118 Transcript_4591/m.29118 type:complete len:113 (+) Transcript_4591:3326-3664(+)
MYREVQIACVIAALSSVASAMMAWRISPRVDGLYARFKKGTLHADVLRLRRRKACTRACLIDWKDLTGRRQCSSPMGQDSQQESHPLQPLFRSPKEIQQNCSTKGHEETLAV